MSLHTLVINKIRLFLYEVEEYTLLLRGVITLKNIVVCGMDTDCEINRQ